MNLDRERSVFRLHFVKKWKVNEKQIIFCKWFILISSDTNEKEINFKWKMKFEWSSNEKWMKKNPFLFAKGSSDDMHVPLPAKGLNWTQIGHSFLKI